MLTTLAVAALIAGVLTAAPPRAEATTVPGGAFASLGAEAKPVASVTDAAGNLFVLNEGDATVSKITPSGVVTRVFAALGGGVSPQAMTIDPRGFLYIACGATDSVTRVSPSGLATAYWAYDGRGSMPRAITSDTAGNVFVANWGTSTVTRITAAGVVSPTFARLDPADHPLGLSVDSGGTVFVADTQTDRISAVSSRGRVTEMFAALPTGSQPVAVAVDPWRSVYSANAVGTVSKFGADGRMLTAALPALPGPHRPTTLLLDPYGDLFIGDEHVGAVTAVDAAGLAAVPRAGFDAGAGAVALIRAMALSGSSLYAIDYVTGQVQRAELAPSITSGSFGGPVERGSPVSLDIGMGGYLPQVILSVGSLPDGLRLDEHTGHLSGIPSTLGTTGFDLLVVNHWGATVPRHEVISVVP
ncbi:virginiamycin B lyase family protein [Subtercola boreus]